jgi:hypothetical protein
VAGRRLSRLRQQRRLDVCDSSQINVYRYRLLSKQRMTMGIDKTGRYGLASTINNLSVGTFEIQDIIVATDGEDVLTPDRDCGCGCDGRVHSEHIGTLDYQISRTCRIPGRR